MATEINKPVSPKVRNAPPVPKANNNVAPAENGEVRTTAANNAVANNAPANNAPANNAPANNAPANNAPANNGPAGNVEPTHDTPKAESKNHVFGFFEGFAKEAVDTAVGMYNLVTTNPITTAKGLVYMATHPKLAVQAITEPYTTAYKDGRYGELAGRASFQVLTVLLSSGALSKSNKSAQVGTKVATPTQTATAAAEKVTQDMAKSIARRQVERQVADGTIKASAKGAAVVKATAEQMTKLTERGITNKIAQQIAASGVADDAITKVMSAAGTKVGADNVYRFASAGLKAGLKPEAIASELAKFSTMSSSKAATAFPAALRGMQAAGSNAAVLAAGVAPKNATAIARQLQTLDRHIAGSTDELTKAAYVAQKEALEKAVAGNSRVAGLVNDVLGGKDIGRFERWGAGVGQGIDDTGKAIGRTGQNINEGAAAVKNFLDGPKTLGQYGEAIASVPRALGHGLDAMADGTLAILKKGVNMLPDFKGFKMPNLANVRVPSPWEILTSPVTVPFHTAKWALTHPGRAIGIAGTLGNIGNAGKLGYTLSQRADEPTEPNTPGYKYYELKEGDTLESIAERELGSAARWEEIYEANQELFDSLGEDGVIAAGTKIKIPTGTGDVPTDNASGAGEYKEALLKLIDEKAAAEQDPETKAVLGQLRERLAEMSPEEVLGLKAQLEAEGLVVPGAPSNNAPANNAPANNAPANNAPANNKPGTNAPANNKPGTNAPANNAPGTNAPANNQPAAPKFTEYTVKKNDNLTTIAERELGNWQRWREIVALNKDQYPSLQTNPDFLAIGWKLKLPAKAAQAPAPAPTKPAADKPVVNAPANNAPSQPNSQQRAEIVKQFNLENSDGNWTKFWQEVSQYPQTTIGPDAGTDADRKKLQEMLGKLGFPVKATGSYYELGADGKPKTDAKGYPVSPTAEAVVAFKRMAGLHQTYNVIGADGKPTPDVNEYVGEDTKLTMAITMRLMQDRGLHSKDGMAAAAKEAARLHNSSIGPEVGSPEAKALVQQYLAGLGYPVKPSGEFDKATTDALLDFKKKSGLSAGFKNAAGQDVFTPYVDGATAEALYAAALKANGTKK